MRHKVPKCDLVIFGEQITNGSKTGNKHSVTFMLTSFCFINQIKMSQEVKSVVKLLGCEENLQGIYEKVMISKLC